MNLLLVILFPVITMLVVFTARNNEQVRWISLTASILQLTLVLKIFADYRLLRSKGASSQMLLEQYYSWFPSLGIDFHIGVDGMAVALLMLTATVVLAGVLVSWNVEKMVKEYYLLLLMLAAGAYGFFVSLNLIVLFFFLEIAVIPKFLLISLWGSGNKTYSANKLAVMLFGASALIFVGMVSLYFMLPTEMRSFDILQLSMISPDIVIQKWVYPLLFIGFGVFTALFPFHTWVPDGHSSAPTAGSMFLAGISMKLGGYGLLRVATYLLPAGAVYYADVVIVLATIAVVYGAFATMMQKDMKYMNAYSSISHCGFVILGIGMLTQTAFTGAVMQMVSHGVMTALFFAVIGMIYERTHTRTIHEISGLMKVAPFITTVLFIVGLCSLGLPGLSGFVAEMMVFVGAWQNEGLFYRVATLLATMSIVVTAVYILRAVTKVAMGPLQNESYLHMQDAVWQEKMTSYILLLGILAIGLAPFWLNELLAPDTKLIMQKILSVKS